MSDKTYYKAVRPDGTDFYSGRIRWDRVGEIVRHPNPGSLGGEDAEGYLSVSVSPADCTGMRWPCRLFEVEGAPVWKPTLSLPSKRASHAWRVVRELPAHEALGPNGVEIVAFLDLLPTLTRAQWDAARNTARSAALDAALDAAWDAAEGAARVAALDAAWDAVWDAVWGTVWGTAGEAAKDAALALLVRDLITTEQFDILTAPMRAAGINFDALREATDTRDQEDEQE